MFGICFLAYGDEHINEFNHISTQLKSIKGCGEIFVCTNDKSKITTDCTIIETNEPFNYNLKRIPIKHALEKYDTIMFMDTDHIFSSNIDFSILSNLEQGFYYKWMNDKVYFMDNLIKPNDIEYGTIIQQLTDKPLMFLDECIFVLKTNKGNLFSNWWEILHNITLNIQPNNSNPGAIEGLIIYSSILNSNIKLKNKLKLFDSFIHTGPLRLNGEIRKRTI